MRSLRRDSERQRTQRNARSLRHAENEASGRALQRDIGRVLHRMNVEPRAPVSASHAPLLARKTFL
jgi:hypothetical protein